ncbi:hypothetical protein L327_0123135 [Yersinia pestis S3]|nr:hypothetical protein L327_0123135 [Yersinia pestis S3]
MYMEKLVVGPAAKGAIDLNLPLEQNLCNIATALNKPLADLTVITLLNRVMTASSPQCSNWV